MIHVLEPLSDTLLCYLSLTTVAIIKIDVVRQIVIQILQHFELATVFRITLQYIDLQYYYY